MQESSSSENSLEAPSYLSKQKMLVSLRDIKEYLVPTSPIPRADPFMARSYVIANNNLIKQDKEIEVEANQLIQEVIQKVPTNFSRIPQEIVDSLSISAWENLLAIFQENQKHISLLPFSMRNTSIYPEDGLPTFNGGDYLKTLNQYVEKTLSRPESTSLHLITLEHFLENTIQLAVKALEDNISAIAAAKTTTVNADEDKLPSSGDDRDMSSITPEEISHYKDVFLSAIQESRSVLNKVVKMQRLHLEKPQHQTKMGDITIQFAN